MVQNVAATRVVGSLKKSIIRDIVTPFVIGIPAAYVYWQFFHVDFVHKREQWYREYAQAKAVADDE